MSDSTATDGSASTEWWRAPRLWLALAFAGLVAWIYQPLFFPAAGHSLAIQSEEFFFEPNEAAGAPVLVLSAWLFYRRTHLLDVLHGGASPIPAAGLLLLAGSLYGWGHFTVAPDLQLASILPLLFGAAFSLGGAAAARAFFVPIVFLVFALPIPPVLLSWLLFPIQLMTAEWAGLILNAIGVKSVVSGDQILRPANTFIVIETCSGVRTMLTLTMLTVLLIDLFERRGRHAGLLLVLAPVVAFVTNGFRVVTLVLNPHSSIHSIHNLQGIAMLLVGLCGIYLLDLGLERVMGTGQTTESEVDYGMRAGDRAGLPSAKSWVASVVTLVAMAGMGRWVEPYTPPSGLAEKPDAMLERVFGTLQNRSIPPDFQFRGSVRYLGYAHREFSFEDRPVEVFLGVANEQLRAFTVLSDRLAWPASGFEPIERSWIDLEDADGEVVRVRRAILQRGARKVVSYSGYLRKRPLPIEFIRQAFALDRSPFVRAEHMLAFRISTSIARGRTDRALESAEERLHTFWRQLSPELRGYAPSDAARGEAAVAAARPL